MIEYPIDFHSESEAKNSEKDWNIKTGEGLEAEMSVPEEFGGDNENPSPEDLFNASLNSCITATFKITAQRKGLEFNKVKVKSVTSLDRNNDGRPVMKKADIEVTVSGAKDNELAEEVAEITEKNCFIHNSVETSVETDFSFE